MKVLKTAVSQDSLPETWLHYYKYAKATLPIQEIEYLTEAYIERIRDHIKLSEMNIEKLKEAMKFVREDENLRLLFWLWHTILFRKESEQGQEITSWPSPIQPKGMKGDMPGLFPALVILSGYDSAIDRHKKIGDIPYEITSATLTTVEEYINLYYEENGYHGLSMYHLYRLLQHFRGELFRIGRFEYHIINFKNPIVVYRNKNTNQEKILSAPHVRYRKDGHVDGTNGIYAIEDESWEAKLKITDQSIIGNLITKEGYASKKTVTLPKDEWELVLKEDFPVLGIHIPRKGKLTKQICKESLDEARKFFRKCFPTIHFKGFVCVSWMLDPQLQELLDQSSNLVEFQKLFDLYPVQSMDHTIYKFVYRSERRPVEELPEETSLQRKIKEYMLAGGHMHTGGGYIQF